MKKLLRAMIPFLMALVTLVACGQDGGESQVRTTAAELPAGCIALDDFTQMPTGWHVLPTPDPDAGGNRDITAALQAAVLAFSTSPATNRTLFIPAGQWTINATVNIRSTANFTITGADPATTSITWVGGTGGNATNLYPDMFRIFDASNGKFSRLTLNGNPGPAVGGNAGARQARIGVHLFQSGCYSGGLCDLDLDPTFKATLTPPVATALIEFDDDVFQGLEFGLAAGAYAMTQPGNGVYDVDFTKGLFPDLNSAARENQLALYATNVGDIVVRRSRFTDITAIGVSVQGSNTFNWLIADSEFTSNFTGIRVSQHGGVHVINTHFAGNGIPPYASWQSNYGTITNPALSTEGMDIFWNGDIGTVIRGNSSQGSRMFLYLSAFGLLGASDVSDNFIQTPYQSGNPAGAPISYVGSQLTFFDNFIQMTGFPPLAQTSSPIPVPGLLVTANSSWGYLDSTPRIVEGGNTFATDASDSTCDSGCTTAGCLFLQHTGNGLGPQVIRADNDTCVLPAALPLPTCAPPIPAAACSAFASAVTPVVAPASLRTPVNVATDSSTAAIRTNCTFQSGFSCGDAITAWLGAQPPASRPFLFFPAGIYYLDKPIDVPPALDVVIAGEGGQTVVAPVGPWNTDPDPYLFHLHAPSKASIQDLHITDNVNDTRHPGPGAILVDSSDDVGGLVYIDTVNVHNVKSAIDVIGLDNVAVRADMSAGEAMERAYGVTGGGKAVSLTGQSPTVSPSSMTQGLTTVACGENSVGNYIELKNWGKAVVLGGDSEALPQGMDLSQSGYLTLAVGRYLTARQVDGFYADQPNVVVHSTFRGRLTLMGLTSTHAVLFGAAATPSAQILSLNNFYETNGAPLGAFQPDDPPCASPYTDASDIDCSFFTRLSPSATAAPTPTQMELNDAARCVLGPPQAGGLAITYCQNNRLTALTDVATSAFVRNMLTDVRAARVAPPLACSSTAVRIHHVTVEGVGSSDPKNFMGPAVRVQRF